MNILCSLVASADATTNSSGAFRGAIEFVANLTADWPAWTIALARMLVAALAGFAVYLLLRVITARLVRRRATRGVAEFIRHVRRPASVLLPLFFLQISLPGIRELEEATQDRYRHIVSLLIILTVTWLLLRSVNAVSRLIRSEYRTDVADNFHARRIHTQLTVLERAVELVIVVIGVGIALMTFPRVRELGTSILASAGIAGVIIGLAARPLVENLIAGIQIALTQPIRIDDVVIVQNEWGRIEEITTTYVVVRIWDERRLIVPFSQFIAEPFQNWTRNTADLLGTVFVYTDYTVPVEAVRAELRRLVEQSPEWDRRVCMLQVTNATERTMELRALVSASNSSAAWNLRVFVREKLIEYLQREHPASLPRTRIACTDGAANGASGAPPTAPRDPAPPAVEDSSA